MKPDRELLRDSDIAGGILRAIRNILKSPVRETVAGSGLTAPRSQSVPFGLTTAPLNRGGAVGLTVVPGLGDTAIAGPQARRR